MSPLLTLGFPQLPGHDGSWEVKLSEFGFYLLLFSLRLSSVGAAPQARLGLCRQGERLGSDQGLTALVWCSPPPPSGGWGCQGTLVNTQHPVRHRSSCTGAPTGSGEFGDRKRESSGMFWFKGHAAREHKSLDKPAQKTPSFSTVPPFGLLQGRGVLGE